MDVDRDIMEIANKLRDITRVSIADAIATVLSLNESGLIDLEKGTPSIEMKNATKEQIEEVKENYNKFKATAIYATGFILEDISRSVEQLIVNQATLQNQPDVVN